MIELRGVSKVYSVPHETRETLFHRLLGGGSYTYEAFHALRDVSFRVGPGEFVGILGRNGSGKSTLLRVVAGIYPPTSGRVSVSDRIAPILDLGVGFQGALSVKDNVFLYGVLLGIPRRRLGVDLGEILGRAAVERFADARLDTLSTGLRARLAFTVALRAEAAVLLVDEALAVGDEAFQRQCLADLARLRAAGRTALLVSHDAELVRQMCDRAIVMDAGEIKGDGPPGAMVDLYRSL